MTNQVAEINYWVVVSAVLQRVSENDP